MPDPSVIREHMEVVAASGIHVGTVDRVEGTTIKLTRNDPDAGGQHHYIPLDWVDTVGLTVRLNKSWDEVKDHWLTSPTGTSN
jgi:hypothetical protein